MIPEKMAEIIEKECKKLNITTAEMLRKAGLCHSAVIAMKKGHYPSVKIVTKICEYLNISADYILGLPKNLNYPED